MSKHKKQGNKHIKIKKESNALKLSKRHNVYFVQYLTNKKLLGAVLKLVWNKSCKGIDETILDKVYAGTFNQNLPSACI